MADGTQARDRPTARERKCLERMSREGESNAEGHGSITATVYCAGIYAFTAVGNKVSGPLTAQAFRAAYPTLGTTYQPVVTFRTDFSSGRHDNAASYRLLAYSDGCGCIAYTSPVRPIPN